MGYATGCLFLSSYSNTIMLLLKNILSASVHLFYPHLCAGCGDDLPGRDNLLCLRCLSELPYTGYELHAGNPVEKIFWGRLPLTAACSAFYFEKEALVQQLIHQLKYKNNTAIGFFLGELMGNRLLESPRLGGIDVLIPLPLFPDKERKRGYNQAAVICNGISAAMQVPVMNNIVIRQRQTETQTRKHRRERWDNVAGSFAINRRQELEGKHILLVDDVVTTGATLEACGSTILTGTGCRLSIATLAMASK